jgi:hypothetical protein
MHHSRAIGNPMPSIFTHNNLVSIDDSGRQVVVAGCEPDGDTKATQGHVKWT